MLTLGTLLVRQDTGELDEDEVHELNTRIVDRIVRYAMPVELYEDDDESFRARLAHGPGKSR